MNNQRTNVSQRSWNFVIVWCGKTMRIEVVNNRISLIMRMLWEIHVHAFRNHHCIMDFSINPEEVFDEIHQNNMSKLDDHGKPIYREDRKTMQPPIAVTGYTKEEFWIDKRALPSHVCKAADFCIAGRDPFEGILISGLPFTCHSAHFKRCFLLIFGCEDLVLTIFATFKMHQKRGPNNEVGKITFPDKRMSRILKAPHL